jgi:serine/threonine protein phosphatase PrpC
MVRAPAGVLKSPVRGASVAPGNGVRSARMKLDWEAAGVTDVGRVRRNDEDAFLVDTDRGLFAVADGVGGSRAGEVASRLAVDTAAGVLAEAVLGGVPGDVPGLIARMFSKANAAIVERAASEAALGQMATTLVLLYLDRASGGAWIAHCGDSRVYRWRGGSLERLTRDHSFAEALAQAGGGGVSVRAQSPFGHVLTRCLGRQDSSPDIRDIDAIPGDRFLLCCDGLTDMIPENDLGELLGPRLSPAESGRRLIDGANAAGGKDNITAVVVDISAG